MDKSIFYNPDHVISYNAVLNLIIGERGVGKTYGFKVKALKRFLNKNKQFVYIRRYETDLSESVGNDLDQKFFEQIKKEFPNSKFKITKNKKVRKLYIDDKICGYAMPLSASDSLKSSTYENVDFIIYDEFMLKEGSTQHYLRNEPEIILDLIETVGRLREIRIYCLGNAISSTCPLMSYFDLSLPYNTDIKLFKDGTIAVEYIKNEKYREVKKASRFGKLIEGTKYGKYAIDNEFLTDSKAFIKKKDKNAKFYFIIIVNNKTYGVWRDFKNQYIYISKDIDPNCPIRIVIHDEDHKEDTMYAKVRSNFWFKQIIIYYRNARLCFESQEVKNLIMIELKNYLNF
ncbi:MAG: phage DNA encapsidation protein [Bacilli bacterium]|nr:phage DNA encapsidation protein [Bacilli bacterium]